MSNEYENDINIDPTALDVEWLRQSSLLDKYSKELAHEKKKFNRAKEKRKTLRSELILEAKKGGKDLVGITATTDVAEAWYRTQDSWKEISQEVIDLEYEVNMLETAVFSIQMKKASLENLVKLFLAGYFSGPKEPRDLAEQAKSMTDGASMRQKEKLNNKKSKDLYDTSKSPAKKRRKK